MCKCGADFASSANTRISVQAPSSTPDAYGGRTEAFSEVFAVWAVVEPMTGREVYVSAQQQSRVDARMTIRYQSSLADTAAASKNRVVIGTRVYNIAAVRNLADDMKTEGLEFQQLMCVEAQPS